MVGLLFAAFWVGCGGNPLGKQVKEPFQGRQYESNNRFYRSTGKASSKQDAIAQSKAEVQARQGLAQQLQTTIQAVSDNYAKDVQGEHVNEAIERFETLVPEPAASPMAQLKQQGRKRQRATGKPAASGEPKKWTWGEPA